MTSTKAKDNTTLQWVGPPGQESELFGPLVAGQRYQCAPDLARYLSDTHPEYWRLVAPPSAKE